MGAHLLGSPTHFSKKQVGRGTWLGLHLLRQRGEGVVVLIGEELQLEQYGAGGH